MGTEPGVVPKERGRYRACFSKATSDISVSGETVWGRRRSSDQAGEWQIDEAKRHKPSNALQKSCSIWVNKAFSSYTADDTIREIFYMGLAVPKQ